MGVEFQAAIAIASGLIGGSVPLFIAFYGIKSRLERIEKKQDGVLALEDRVCNVELTLKELNKSVCTANLCETKRAITDEKILAIRGDIKELKDGVHAMWDKYDSIANDMSKQLMAIAKEHNVGA